MKVSTFFKVITLIGLLLMSYCSFAQTGNYFAGFQSGTGNTGSYNAFVGYQTGVSSNTGWYNSFYGYQAGYLNRGGSYNVFVGSFAGYDNTSGLSNTFVGWASGSNNTTASSNSFFGNLAGYQTSTGGSNSFFGSASAYNNTTGSNNSFFGSRAGYNNTTAANNTFIGFSAGEKNNTGALNTYVGSVAGFSSTSAYENTFIGNQAGNLITTGYRNAFLGQRSGLKTTTGRENTFLGRSAGFNNTTGFGNSAVGYLAGPSSANLSNSTAIGHRSYVTASNALVLGSISGVNGAANTVRVGIGTTAPGYLLHVNGTAAKPGGGSWTVASDKRLKGEIEIYKDGLDKIMQIKPVWFRYNGKAGLPTDKKYVGVIAQEMQKILPNTVGEFMYQDSNGRQEKYLDYDASSLTYMLVNAVKELKLENDRKTAQIDQLLKELTEVKLLLNKQVPGNESPRARLWQNQPNPYAKSTLVKYYIPENVQSAKLKVITLQGQEIFEKQIMERGQGEIEFTTQTLQSGSYIYHLVIDGTSVDSKKMVLAW